jgi:GNAT superfamily N-acetyltransferase
MTLSTAVEPPDGRAVTGRLAERDLPEAERIARLAFGTFVGAPDPATFWADRDYVRSRWRAAHTAAFGANVDGQLVGSNFATRWGSVGFLGPLTIHPDFWDRGIARDLLAATMAQFDAWKSRMPGCSPSPIAPSTLRSTRNSGLRRASSLRSWRRRRCAPTPGSIGSATVR